MIFSRFSEAVSDYIIKDIKEDVPKINNISFRKEKKGYLFYNKNNMKTGKITELDYKILKNIDNKSNHRQILKKINES